MFFGYQQTYPLILSWYRLIISYRRCIGRVLVSILFHKTYCPLVCMMLDNYECFALSNRITQMLTVCRIVFTSADIFKSKRRGEVAHRLSWESRLFHFRMRVQSCYLLHLNCKGVLCFGASREGVSGPISLTHVRQQRLGHMPPHAYAAVYRSFPSTWSLLKGSLLQCSVSVGSQPATALSQLVLHSPSCMQTGHTSHHTHCIKHWRSLLLCTDIPKNQSNCPKLPKNSRSSNSPLPF